jgi:hypothetical protein
MTRQVAGAVVAFVLRSGAHAPSNVVAGPCLVPNDRADTVERLAQSIARHEGWGLPQSLVRRLHNPGALVYAGQRGATTGPRGYAVFANDTAGWTALRNDIASKFRLGITVRRMMDLWCGGCYLDSLLEETGMAADSRGS